MAYRCTTERTYLLAQMVLLVIHSILLDSYFLLFSLCGTYLLDTIQDFLCKLGMKPHMHVVEISIFSLNHVIVRPTKIIKDLHKAST